MQHRLARVVIGRPVGSCRDGLRPIDSDSSSRLVGSRRRSRTSRGPVASTDVTGHQPGSRSAYSIAAVTRDTTSSAVTAWPSRSTPSRRKSVQARLSADVLQRSMSPGCGRPVRSICDEACPREVDEVEEDRRDGRIGAGDGNRDALGAAGLRAHIIVALARRCAGDSCEQTGDRPMHGSTPCVAGAAGVAAVKRSRSVRRDLVTMRCVRRRCLYHELPRVTPL